MRVRVLPVLFLAIVLALPLGGMAWPGLYQERPDASMAVPLPLGPPPAEGETVPASHGWWVPYMDTAALDIPYGIRPGAWLRMGESYCTASFVVKDPSGALYITTAAHCTHGLNERVDVKQNTVVAAVGEWLEFGTVVARWPGGLDAALVKIDTDRYDMVAPSMPGWGGPTGVATERPNEILHYGWGWVTWQEHQVRCRSGSALSWGSTTWWIDSLGGGGDSGSGVMSADGLAMGILDWARNVNPDPVGGAFYAEELGGVRLDVAMQRLGQQIGQTLELVEGGPVTIIPGAGVVDDECYPEPPNPLA